MKAKSLFAVSLLLFASINFATAEEIGRATVNGRSVIIDSKGTWVYADAAAPGTSAVGDCDGYAFKSKRLPLSSCLRKGWELSTAPPGAMEIQAYQVDVGIYSGIIVEPMEMTYEALRKAIIFNAATGSGVRPEDIIVVKEDKQTFGDHSWNYIEYDVTFSGTKFRFGNFHTALEKGGVAQVVFWSSPAFFEKNGPTLIEVMSSTKFEK
jgi:hypothetical protein